MDRTRCKTCDLRKVWTNKDDEFLCGYTTKDELSPHGCPLPNDKSPERYCDCNNEITDPEKDVCGDCR